jgi:hypothetical protein
MTREPLPHEAANPFRYAEPTAGEISAVLGGKKWVIARRTPRIVERYGEDVVCVSQQAYKKAEAKAIEARGWARPCELVIRKILVLTGLERINASDPADDAMLMLTEAKALLEKARNP